ncbi:hypothetical protein C8Q75DRAFT_223386 [Abortiporus biennis]|nr:hypothetical protein C8Q75DRAFT_223386 [Abortiporus biennis]
MPIVKRYNPSAEYAEMLSTTPHDGGTKQSKNDTWTTAAHNAFSNEASSWYDAVVPSSKDMQDLVHRIHSYSNMTQQTTFEFIYPLCIFATLFAFAVVALQPNSFAHHILANPREHPKELGIGALALVGIILGILLILRIIIWATAEIVSTLMKNASPRVRKKMNTQPLPTTKTLLGSIFNM